MREEMEHQELVEHRFYLAESEVLLATCLIMEVMVALEVEEVVILIVLLEEEEEEGIPVAREVLMALAVQVVAVVVVVLLIMELQQLT